MPRRRRTALPGHLRRREARPWAWVGLGLLALMAAVIAGCATTRTTPTTPTTGPTGSGGSVAASSHGWVKDSIHSLNVFLPDADSVYWFDGYGTADGSRTVINGQVPDARYWSFTAYPTPTGPPRQHVHDTDVDVTDGRYTVTVATSCRGVSGTCLAMGSSDRGGIVVLRLYVPVDLATSGSGGVPLPTIHYLSSAGRTQTLDQASGSPAVGTVIDAYRAQHGALPPALTRSYPPAAPVPEPVVDPAPRGVVSHGEGPYANPDNVYQHVRYRSTRGDLVVTARAPTYQADASTKANDLARPASADPQVRYWSLCTILQGRHTGACLRDEQVRIPTDGTFSVIVAPVCPVAGYANCLPAGPEPLQDSLSYRNLLPSPAFADDALSGPYSLTAGYVGRP